MTYVQGTGTFNTQYVLCVYYVIVCKRNKYLSFRKTQTTQHKITLVRKRITVT